MNKIWVKKNEKISQECLFSFGLKKLIRENDFRKRD